MKTLITVLCAAALTIALAACGQSNGSSGAAVDIDVAVRAEPEQLAVGETTLVVTLTDATGAPVDGASVRAHGDMDHEGMEPIDGEASSGNHGEYRVPFAWTMGGGWIVTVTAKLSDGSETSQTFEFFVEAISSESVINRQSASSTDGSAVTIAYQPDNNPALLGDSTVTIVVTDHAGAPITDATVSVRGDMAHHGMMPSTGEGSHHDDGHYVVPIQWTMVGDWQVTVHVTLPDGRIVERVFDQQVVIE